VIQRAGYDAAKRTFGQKRHIPANAVGLILLTHVHAAHLHDRLVAQLFIGRAAEGDLPSPELVWADGA
jgi:L-ascorbate metabolism protein UlaG (beta-lactamase superfamily)